MSFTSLILFLSAGCAVATDSEPTTKPEDSESSPWTAANVPWLDAGEPGIAAPEIDWLDAGTPTVAPPSRTCPVGWVEEPLETGGHVCNPWPSGARATCDSSTAMHLPGTEGCAEVGTTCPGGDWPTDAADTDLFVAEGGTGDGSRVAPFGTLAAALAVAGTGDRIVLGAGSFQGGATITADVTIVGLCPSLTTLTWPEGTPDAAILAVDGAALSLRDLRLGDSDAMGISADGATVTLEGVVIDQASNFGVSAIDSDVTADDVLVSRIRPNPTDDTNGTPWSITGASSITASRVTVADSHRVGFWIEGETAADLSDISIFGMRPQVSDNNRGAGIRLYDTLDVAHVARVAIEGGNDYGVATSDFGSSFEDLWIADVGDALDDGSPAGGFLSTNLVDTRIAGLTVRNVPSYGARCVGSADIPPGPCVFEDIVAQDIWRTEVDTFGGIGVAINGSPAATLTRILTEDTDGDGVYVEGDAVAALTDIRARRAGPLGGFGAALTVNTATVTLERAILESGVNYVLVCSAGALDLTDVSLSNADLAEEDIGLGAGLGVFSGVVNASRLLVADTWVLGLDVQESGTFTGEDVVVRDVAPIASLPYGILVNTYTASASIPAVTLTRADLDGGVGTAATGIPASFTFTDTRIRNIGSLPTTGQFGFGIDNAGGTTTLTRVSIEDVQDAGVYLYGGTASLTDVVVRGVTPQACLQTLCPDETQAIGTFLGEDTDATLTRVLFDSADGVGLQVVGTGTLADVVSQDNGIGVDTIVGTLTGAGLTLSGNGTDWADSAQPLPSADWQ